MFYDFVFKILLYDYITYKLIMKTLAFKFYKCIKVNKEGYEGIRWIY